MSCAFEHEDGAYVLGSLSAEDRRAYEAHLAGCADCQRSVGLLAGLPGLLARVDAEVLDADADDEPPETLLSTLLRDVRRRRRRRVWLATGAAAASVVLVATGAFALARVTAPEDGATGSASGASGTDEPDGQWMAPVAGVTEVRATLDLVSVAWGTRLDLTCSYEKPEYAPAPGAYVLVVRTRDGRTEQVATWKPLPGRTMRLAAATAASRADIASVEMRTADGKPVLELTE